MTRVKRGTAHVKRRKNLLEDAKGYRWNRKNLFREAKQAVIKAGKYAYRDRRAKKRNMRSLWITRINAGCRPLDINYSRLMYGLLKAKVKVDRKILSELAVNNPEIFKQVVEVAKK